MFEALTARAERRAQDRARRLSGELAMKASESAPPGVSVIERDPGLELRGRGLRRRTVTDPRLRAFLEALR
jgi:tRNA(Ile2) C34 agmatinyltransferase TiaS